MSRRRHSPKQVVPKLREADRLLSEGMELLESALPFSSAGLVVAMRSPAPPSFELTPSQGAGQAGSWSI
jgi:hypothetical protein